MITLNGTPIPQQPSSLNENPETIKTDTNSINGSRQRMQSPSKKRAVFVIKNARPATFQFIQGIYDLAAVVTYRNNQSNVAGGILEFTGIIDYDEAEFVRGGSLMTDVTVTIRES